LSSSLLWVAFAWLQGLAALGLRDLLGVAITLYGSYRWLAGARPRRAGVNRTDLHCASQRLD
jgi:hypothetical protein